MVKVTLIVIGGFAGGGKTTLATKLSSKLGFPIFSSDSINDAIRSTLKISFSEAAPAAHAVMWQLVHKELRNDISVIVDAPMCRDEGWRQFDNIKSQFSNVLFLPIVLHTTLAIHQQRIEERGINNLEHLNLGGESFDDIKYKHQYIEKLRRTDVIKIDASGSPEDTMKQTLNAINKHGI